MHPTQVCIVARPMNRPTTRATPILVGILLMIASVSGIGCEELDGRNRTRQGNRMFRETQFIDAAAQYEKALKTVNDPIIHYNAALTYSKIFKPDTTIRLGVKGTFVCNELPNTKTESARVCVKDGDRRFDNCDDKNVCASSYKCLQSELCVYDAPLLAELATSHYQQWLLANPKDDETRELMTQVWIDGSQFDLAIKYWEGLLEKEPDNTKVMGILAGINLKAGEWRRSVQLYLKVANATQDPAQKVLNFQAVGNVAWAKLNSKTLPGPEAIELADFGIGALQKAAELNPKNPKLFGLQGSIYLFRAMAQGAAWAAALDRASAQDLQRTSRVLAEEAKKAAGGAVPTTPPTPAPKAGG